MKGRLWIDKGKRCLIVNQRESENFFDRPRHPFLKKKKHEIKLESSISFFFITKFAPFRQRFSSPLLHSSPLRVLHIDSCSDYTKIWIERGKHGSEFRHFQNSLRKKQKKGQGKNEENEKISRSIIRSVSLGPRPHPPNDSTDAGRASPPWYLPYGDPTPTKVWMQF